MSKDISKCSNSLCPIRYACKRYTMTGSKYQSYSHFSGGENCIHFIPNTNGMPYTPEEKKEYNHSLSLQAVQQKIDKRRKELGITL